MNGRLNKVFIVTLVILISFTALTLGPVSAGGGITAGPWRDINPTQYASAGDSTVPGPNVPFNGVYVRTAGFGAVGAGDAWAVGGCGPSPYFPFSFESTSSCGSTVGGGTIAHYDGFSWTIEGNPFSTDASFYSAVNFCTSPGAPSVGLCSPNSDGSDGWIVGGISSGPVALYVTSTSSVSPASANLPCGTTCGSIIPSQSGGYLTSVFETCHVENDPNGQGCPTGISGEAYAVGTNGANGVIYEYSGPAPTGGSWNLVWTSSIADIYTSIYMFIDSSGGLEGFAVGDKGVIARLFGGSWSDTTPGTSSTPFHGVAVDNGNPIDAWAVGYDTAIPNGEIYHFSNGIWAGAVSPTPSTVVLESIFLLSASEGWIVGTESTILHGTGLPGSSFQQIGGVGGNPLFTGTGPGIDLNSVSFPNGGNGWAVGTHGVILQTSDSSCGSIVQTSSPSACWGGQTSIVQSPSLRAVYETSQSDAWAGGLYDVPNNWPSMIHWDGYKWHRANLLKNVGGQGITQPDILGIYMAGSGEGYAVGGQLSTSTPSPATCGQSQCPVAYTWNTIQPDTWQPVSVAQCANSNGCEMTSVYFATVGPIDGWAVGTNGGVWGYSKSSPGWDLYSSLPSGFDANLNGVFINNPGNNNPAGWAVGDGGVVLYLNCNAAPCVWTQTTIPGLLSSVDLYGIYFTDSNHGWIVGSANTIITTTDGKDWVVGIAANPTSPSPTWTSVHVDTYGSNAGSGDGWAVGCSVPLTGTPPTCSGDAVAAWWNGAVWAYSNLVNALGLYSGLGLFSVFTTSPTDGWAVGAQPSTGTTPLTGIFHLDPVNPPVVGQQATTTQSTTQSSTVQSTTVQSSLGSTSSVSEVTTSTSSPTESVATTSSPITIVSTSVSTMTVVSTASTTSSSSTTSTPLVLPAIPGFPWESIIVGFILAMIGLATVRRRKK